LETELSATAVPATIATNEIAITKDVNFFMMLPLFRVGWWIESPFLEWVASIMKHPSEPFDRYCRLAASDLTPTHHFFDFAKRKTNAPARGNP
jgi:hypothetical protein